jgi:hypothetical protein
MGAAHRYYLCIAELAYTFSKCRIEDENRKGNNPFAPTNSAAKARSKRIKRPKKTIVPLLTRLSQSGART